MSYFGIPAYRPQWISGRAAIESAHGRRLAGLVGRRLSAAWLVWDRDADEWFRDCPVVLGFDGEQLEINHHKFDELSITWNQIDPVRTSTWSWGVDSGPEAHSFNLVWRRDAVPALAAFEGQLLGAVELLEWRPPHHDIATGMVAVSFVFADDRVTVSNALDENGLEYGVPQADYIRRVLRA
ncbi:hypothetical protein F5X71_16545 [Nocardia brasiliensis]|uniref:Uncharacterized protein n=1 Tax=Nocardia brasiliensis TaxID=37326 RepID=A0A6G9Y313_NOCBR|nr:hypothetical protein F5X71_16545 [Nocardia brasiliensis]